VSLQLPGSLTPSKVATFKECALAFRLSAIDKLPEPPNLQAFKGTVVHRALELLMWEEGQGHRSREAAFMKLQRALDELLVGDEGLELALGGQELDEFVDDARELVRNYFVLEDPNEVRVIGTELRLQADLGLRLRGIIDRLELDSDGELVVTDYKTGRAPGVSHEQSRLGGVHFYAFLCQRVLGKRPARVQLFHLREPIAISTTPDDQSIAGLEMQASAIWAAIMRACSAEDFRPKPGRLCEWCGYHAYCPAMGGDLSLVPQVRAALQAVQPDGGQGALLAPNLLVPRGDGAESEAIAQAAPANGAPAPSLPSLADPRDGGDLQLFSFPLAAGT
jgi:putative RecB family exonuclease